MSVLSRLTSLKIAGLFAGVVLGVAAVSPVNAQLAAWDTHGLAGGANNFGPSPFAPTTTAANVTIGGITRGSGVGTTGTAAARAWGGTDWLAASAAAAVTASDFFTFTATANSGFTVSYSSISKFDYRRSTTGPGSGVLQYSTGGGFTDITTLTYSSTAGTGASLAAIDLSGISALQNVPSSTTVTFRIANFGGTNTAGTWYIYDVANTTAADFALSGTTASAGGTTSTTYDLSSSAGNTSILQTVGSTSITSTITNVGTGTADTLNFTGLGASAGAGSITGSATNGGPLANAGGTSSNTGLTFSSGTTGAISITPTVTTATNATLGGSATIGTTTGTTINVFSTAVLTPTNTAGTLNLANAAGAFVAGATVESATLASAGGGWSSTTGSIAQGTNLNVATFTPTSTTLNGSYSNTVTVTARNLASIAGSASGDVLNASPFNLLATVSGNVASVGVAQTGNVLNGGTYTGLGSSVAAGGSILGSTATIVQGQNNSGGTITVSETWRARNSNEIAGTATNPPINLAVSNGLISDVVDISGMIAGPGLTQTDVFTLQLTYDPAQIVGSTEVQAAAAGDIYLTWLNPDGAGPSVALWVNAVLGNYGSGGAVFTNVQSSYASFATLNGITDGTISAFLGSWGVDTATDTVWAILNHNSSFSVVPEPGTMALLSLGGLAMLRRRRAAKKA